MAVTWYYIMSLSTMPVESQKEVDKANLVCKLQDD